MKRNSPAAKGSGAAEPSRKVLEFYAEPSAMTAPGRHAELLRHLPDDPGELARIVQGLLIYEHLAADFYGVRLPEERRQESHIRSVERMLDALLAIDDRPLAVARPPERRLVGVCHHYMLLTVAMLRAKGVPARGRGGFGAYFNPGYFEDHWLCEYWNASERRWVMLDAQLDEVWRSRLGVAHDWLDLPRDAFLTASDAWRACRAGALDPARFGIIFGELRGLWFIAGSLVRDAAALDRREMLPWDVWGAAPLPHARLNDEQLRFFDRLAELTREPDEAFAQLRALHATDDRVRVPPSVFNALRQRHEPVLAT